MTTEQNMKETKNKEPYSNELWKFMELCYKNHGASNNGAQLIMRGNILENRVKQYGEEKVRWMLENDFNTYHYGESKKENTITVEDLIKKLSVFPKDYNVYITNKNHFCNIKDLRQIESGILIEI